MGYNYIVIFALISVVRCSVIINIYEDDDNKASHSVRDSCNYQACDQLCRRLGYTGGACVGNKCQCDHFQPLNIQSKALDYVLLKSPEKAPVEACNDITCNQFCKSYGYEGGFCRGGDCYCWKHNAESGKALDYVLLKSPSTATVEACVDQTCNQMCKNLGYKGGLCIGGNCYCWKHNVQSGKALDYLLLKSPKTTTVEACVDQTCNQMCKNLGYQGGLCSGGDCYCWKHNIESDDAEWVVEKMVSNNELDNNVINEDEKPVKGLHKDKMVSLCNDTLCHNFCLGMNYYGGFCMFDKCYCF